MSKQESRYPSYKDGPRCKRTTHVENSEIWKTSYLRLEKAPLYCTAPALSHRQANTTEYTAHVCFSIHISYNWSLFGKAFEMLGYKISTFFGSRFTAHRTLPVLWFSRLFFRTVWRDPTCVVTFTSGNFRPMWSRRGTLSTMLQITTVLQSPNKDYC